MEELIKQVFLNVELLSDEVMEGHHDLVGPHGEILLPQVWEMIIKPDWSITMHMWPVPEPNSKHKPWSGKSPLSSSRILRFLKMEKKYAIFSNP